MKKILIIFKEKNYQNLKFNESDYFKVITTDTALELPNELPLRKDYKVEIYGSPTSVVLLGSKLSQQGIPFSYILTDDLTTQDEDVLVLPAVDIDENNDDDVIDVPESNVFQSILDEFLPIQYHKNLTFLDDNTAELKVVNTYKKTITFTLKLVNDKIQVTSRLSQFLEMVKTINKDGKLYNKTLLTRQHLVDFKNLGTYLNKEQQLLNKVSYKKVTHWSNFKPKQVQHELDLGNKFTRLFSTNKANAQVLLDTISIFCRNNNFEAYLGGQHPRFTNIILIDGIGNQLNLVVDLSTYLVKKIEFIETIQFDFPLIYTTDKSIKFHLLHSVEDSPEIKLNEQLKTSRFTASAFPLSLDSLDDFVTLDGYLQYLKFGV